MQGRHSLNIGERRRLSVALLIAVSIHTLAFCLIGLSAFAPAHVHSSPAVTWVIHPVTKARPDTHRLAADNQRAGAGNKSRRQSPATLALSARITPAPIPEPAAPTGKGTPPPPQLREPANRAAHFAGQRNIAANAGLAARRDARAAYLASWRQRIEHEGSKHFPARDVIAHAKQAPIVRVTIRADGSVQGVSIARSSGSADLDRAAVNIVHAAAPFSALPDALRSHDNSSMNVTYEWHFRDGELSGAE